MPTVLSSGWPLLRRELKFLDLVSYFPKNLREEDIQRFAEDIFTRGMHVKPQLRKGVWPHLVRVFHPALETREERESFLSKLRLIYDALKGRLQSQNDGHMNQMQHLYDSIRRDALRTDPAESFYNGRHQDVLNSARVTSPSYLTQENVEKLVNITAVFTLEHSEVSYTQGMTDLLSPILYVMEREDDAYIVFAAMIQRISDNFGTWCEGTLNKVERLRHLCAVLDPQLSAFLEAMEEDAFALFFGMVLIECRREFSFESSFHLMEVIWAAALCMRQREDPNWSPLVTTVARNDRRIQASLDLSEGLDSTPSFSEWASFMSNRSPDVIRQVFGELRTYTAVPLTRSESLLYRSVTHSATYPHSHSPPPSPHVTEQPLADTLPNEMDQSRKRTSDANLLGESERFVFHQQAPEATPVTETQPEGSRSGEGTQNDNEKSGHSEKLYSRNVSSLNKEEEIGNETTISCNPIESLDSGSDLVVLDSSTHFVTKQEDYLVLLDEAKERSQSEPLQPHSGSCRVPSAQETEKTAVSSETEGTPNHHQLANGQIASGSYSESNLAGTPPQSRKTTTQTHTEMSDMSSVGSTNTNGGVNSRGNLVASGCLESDGQAKSGEGENGLEEDDGKVGGVEGGRPNQDEDDHWLVVIPDSNEDLHRAQVIPVDTESLRSASPKSKCDVIHSNVAATCGLATSNSHDLNDRHFESEDRTHLDISKVHDSLHQFLKPVSRRESTGLVDEIPRHMVAAVADDSPSTRDETDSTIREWSLTAEREYAVSPKQPFFDALETIASISRDMSPASETDGIPRPNSTLSNIIANLLSVEGAVPAVTRESSLSVPFSDSFPLFICLSIIVQHRTQILQGNLDFVGLSVLLNTQAGTQKLDRTINIARQLYARYREYQRSCFGPRFSVYEIWLDQMESLFDAPNSSIHSQPHATEEAQTTGREGGVV